MTPVQGDSEYRRLDDAQSDGAARHGRWHHPGRLSASARPASAVGEVCFNTAMTGYEEILTDPSYAGQIITFTFPHIGNVGTNEEDIETVNLAASAGARGVIVRADVTDPSNFRATRRLDAWLKARGIIGLYGLDTRALTARIRESGMPNAVIAHQPDWPFDREALARRGRGMARHRRHGSGAGRHFRPALRLGRNQLDARQGLRAARRGEIQGRRDRLRDKAQYPAPVVRLRLRGHCGSGDRLGRRHSGDEARWRFPFQRSGRSGGNRRLTPCR